MLVTLGSAVTISSGASQTFQYACNSVQQIYVSTEETTAVTASTVFCTVQIGNETVVNDIRADALGLLSIISGGGSIADGDQGFKIDLGSHVLFGEENLYVTLRNSNTVGDLNALDVSAIVNEGGVYQPVRYTDYADSTFTDTNTLAIYAWADASLENDTSAFTVRNQTYSSAPQVASGCAVSRMNSYPSQAGGSVEWKQIATMAKNQVPMNTSVNYSSAIIDGVICLSAMDRQPGKARASAQAGRAVLNSMTSSERKAL